ncbi:signal transduction protein [Citrobacter koseri]|nr:signal transduction protein [Citrobacter koseri]
MRNLRNFGFRIAIDDFGTGYANYERLKRLRADIIKIDGCFIKDIMTDSLDAMIVKSITDLAKAKSLCVVAEFVETPEQRELLLSLGVNYLQGYLIGRPRPLEAPQL